MKIYKITESYTGYVDYVIKANSEEEAMKLYNDNLDNSSQHKCQDVSLIVSNPYHLIQSS